MDKDNVQGTIKGPSKEEFKPETAAKALREAFKGLGTDEKVVVDVIASHANWQRQEIKKVYKAMYGRELINDLEDEVGGHFLEALLAMICPKHVYDAHCIRRAMKGSGTDEDALIEIICSRTNSEISLIQEAYVHEFGRHLEDDVVSETSSHFGRMLRSLLTANRDEHAKIDLKLAEKDATKLQAAGVSKLGTDEEVFNSVLCLRSWPQLRATFQAYTKKTGKDIEQDVRKEFSGDIRKGLIAIIKVAKDPIGFFAQKLGECMNGPGTDDETLIRLLVSRSEVDLSDIKTEYQRLYKKTLTKAVKDDCSGDYCRLLLKVIG